jgi:hypothetical protein
MRQAGQRERLAVDREAADHMGGKARHASGDAVARVHAQGTEETALDPATGRRARGSPPSMRPPRTRDASVPPFA